MGWSGEDPNSGHAATSVDSAADDRWGALLVPQQLVENDTRSRDRAFLLVRYTVIAAFFSAVFTPYFSAYVGLPNVMLVMVLYELSLGITLLILRWTRSQRIAANWTLTSAFAVLMFQALHLRGLAALAGPWIACLPVAAMLLRGVRGGAVWTVVSVIGLAVVGVADAAGMLPEGLPTGATARTASIVTLGAVTIALGTLAWLAESRAEELLNNLKIQKDMFEERAVRDWLTGLANRSLLTECLIRSWERARRQELRGALFFIDLDDFKLVNDEHGHAAGDRVLQEVALRLQKTVRSSDLVGRVGGDEFALIVEGVKSQNDVAVLAEKIAKAVEEPIDIGPALVRVGASLGVAFFPDRECQVQGRAKVDSNRASQPPVRGKVDHDSVRRLVEKADMAMYASKRKGLRFWIHKTHRTQPRSLRATGST